MNFQVPLGTALSNFFDESHTSLLLFCLALNYEYKATVVFDAMGLQSQHRGWRGAKCQKISTHLVPLFAPSLLEARFFHVRHQSVACDVFNARFVFSR